MLRCAAVSRWEGILACRKSVGVWVHGAGQSILVWTLIPAWRLRSDDWSLHGIIFGRTIYGVP